VFRLTQNKYFNYQINCFEVSNEIQLRWLCAIVSEEHIASIIRAKILQALILHMITDIHIAVKP
jgi:hypothetical protein